LKKATFLLEKGKINYGTELFTPIMSNPWNLKKLWGIVLSNMEKTTINGKIVGYSWAKREEYESQGLNSAEIRLAISCMQDIKDLDLIFVLTELDGHIKGSFRSKVFDTTVYSTALGGGGHKGASAFVIENKGMEKAIKEVLSIVKEKGFVIAD
jgi:nanoRNase/pAp phosphatase (c-di-AMP/oligoRNAs hydrolase)